MYLGFFKKGFFKDFIYLFMKDRESGRDIDRGRSRLLTGSLMWDLIPEPGSRPEPKADAQPLSHPGAPNHSFPRCVFPQLASSWGVMLPCASVQLLLSKDFRFRMKPPCV